MTNQGHTDDVCLVYINPNISASDYTVVKQVDIVIQISIWG